MTFTSSLPPSPTLPQASVALLPSHAAGHSNIASSTSTTPPAATAEQVAADNARKSHAGGGMALELRSILQGAKFHVSRMLPKAEQLNASRLGMEGMQKQHAGEFRQQINVWIKSHEHLTVDTSHLHKDQVNILLEELSNAKPGSIKTLDMPLGNANVSMESLTAALKTISERNPESKLAISFLGRKMTAAEGETLGKSLADTRLSALGLDATQGHEGMSATLAMIPGSKIGTLDINGRDVSRYEKEIIDASAHLDKLVLNKSMTPGVAQDASARAQHTEAMDRIVTTVQGKGKTVEVTDTVRDLAITERDLENPAHATLESFKQAVSHAFSEHHAVTADLYYTAGDGADLERQKALLHAMASNVDGKLQVVDFKAWDLPGMKDGLGASVMQAMKDVSRNHPQVKLTANFLNTPFTPEDAAALAEALPIAKIRFLTLDGCGINATGTAKIAEALKHTPGAVADMCNNTFDSAGVQHLATALPTLEMLMLSAANFSAADKSTLDDAAGKANKQIVWQ